MSWMGMNPDPGTGLFFIAVFHSVWVQAVSEAVPSIYLSRKSQHRLQHKSAVELYPTAPITAPLPLYDSYHHLPVMESCGFDGQSGTISETPPLLMSQ
ncbi:hypothetical protein GDO81_028967 [Engystomops pustulosus]|uniref:Uncharacterized protein n=1 Tax=Engystomops pustulosus TaxID=76066 RepID=A0AAV6YZC9_ENGPU|nr:hypothetical protein GDO81_028967 [Engystomops pustulosus]